MAFFISRAHTQFSFHLDIFFVCNVCMFEKKKINKTILIVSSDCITCLIYQPSEVCRCCIFLIFSAFRNYWWLLTLGFCTKICYLLDPEVWHHHTLYPCVYTSVHGIFCCTTCTSVPWFPRAKTQRTPLLVKKAFLGIHLVWYV